MNHYCSWKTEKIRFGGFFNSFSSDMLFNYVHLYVCFVVHHLNFHRSRSPNTTLQSPACTTSSSHTNLGETFPPVPAKILPVIALQKGSNTRFVSNFIIICFGIYILLTFTRHQLPILTDLGSSYVPWGYQGPNTPDTTDKWTELAILWLRLSNHHATFSLATMRLAYAACKEAAISFFKSHAMFTFYDQTFFGLLVP